MLDLPPDLPRLRTLETALTIWLRQVRQAIAAAEQAERDAANTPRWWVHWDRRRDGIPPTGTLHRAGCWRTGAPDLDDDQARAVLAEHGARIDYCEACRPELRRPE